MLFSSVSMFSKWLVVVTVYLTVYFGYKGDKNNTMKNLTVIKIKD